VCTKKQYEAKERAAALIFAPPAPISEQEFVYQATSYPLPVIRQASVRYGPARGRTYNQVLQRFLDHLRNPNLNQGDDLSLALGHITATYEWMREGGLL
jgi:hypothetical protein